jgi:gliding motility-associated-like protein
MRALLAVACILALPFAGHTQLSNIVAAEYFFDADPGVGAATALPAFVANPNLDVTFLAASAGLSQGMHVLGIRVKDNSLPSNLWSIPVYRPVYIFPNSPTISDAEYFFDMDPGSGNATPISVAAGATIDVTFAANSSALSMGMHIMGVRTRNTSGNWSIPAYIPFYIDRSRTITQLEYFFDSDPGSGNATTIVVTPPTDLLDQIYSMNSSALALGAHTLNVRVAGQNNSWGMPETVSFTITASPTISSFTPPSGIVGTTVTITGTNFDTTPANNVVSFNGTMATVTSSTTTSIIATVPGGAASGPITVTILGSTATSSTNFVVCPGAPTVTPSSACANISVTLTASGGSAGQYRWYTVATGGTAISGEVNSSYSTPLTATTTFYVAIDNGTCESARTAVTATIFPLPAAPTVTPASACGPSAPVTLIAAGGAIGQYRWYTVAAGGTAIAGETNSTYTTPSLTATTTYHVAINNGTCESLRTSVTATITPGPTAPTTTGAAGCSGNTITLNALGGINGQYRWYTVATGGTAIAGATNNAYTTPSLTATTTYHVAINDGNCESVRASVTATVFATPTPTATGASACPGSSFALTASGGTNGQYRWYSVPTAGTAIAGAVNSNFTTAALTATTTYYVAIVNGVCESTRTAVTATVLTTGCAPVISPTPLATQVEGKITLDLKPLISTVGILDPNSIKVVTQPASGALATISNGVLTIDYKGKPFSGTESILIEACNTNGICSQQAFDIEVAGEVIVYNAVSPNGDQKNDFLFLQYIEVIPAAAINRVSIYNRWGDEVFSVADYDNRTRVFAGTTPNGDKLPTGTYFYKIVMPNANKTLTGFLNLKY